ncbi:MAG: hypothetical protein ACUZ8H_12605 [Candidatus Anammoxibacter sp.]
MINRIIDERYITIDHTIDRSKITYNAPADKCVKEKPKSRPKYYKKAINYGMAVTLVTSIIGAFTGHKKAHIISGALFMCFGALHVYKHKKNVF